jgi:Ni,Fe-hydrogenase III large subunit
VVERRHVLRGDRAQHRRDAVTAFHRELVAECASGVPAGAYADAHGVYYAFLSARGVYAHSRVLTPELRLRALSADVPLFSWDEREMAQDRDVTFEALPDARPLFSRAGAMPAAVTARGEGITQIVVGPVHAGVIEPGRFTFSSGGETVVHLDAQLGYAHRGIERALEGRPALEAASAVARICGGCSAARSYAYALAVEELAGFEPAPEIDLARAIVAELERIYNHLADLAAAASGAGFGVGFAHGMALKERAMRLCAAVCGHRLLFDAIVPGGLGRLLLADRTSIRTELAALERDAHRFLTALFANASLVSRWEGAGIVPAETARAFGAVGPALRASRGSLDVRTFIPYGAYRRFVPAVAVAAAGDALARCTVKRDELIASLLLVRGALHELGATALPPPAPVEPSAGVARRVVEGPRGSELVALHVDARGRLERIHVISASYRNWPLVVRAMENNIVPDFPLVNKSFNLCYACADR